MIFVSFIQAHETRKTWHTSFIGLLTLRNATHILKCSLPNMTVKINIGYYEYVQYSFLTF
jgi:hypothetical protein